MKKTLLLCFIHGFKGGEDTFGNKYIFAERLKDLVQADLPKINVKTLVYPRYETKGDLGETVSRFRSWLEDKVIDLEVAAGTPSPTVDPSVRTILIGHSMGGIVAAETVISLTSDKPIYSAQDGIEKPDSPSSFNTLMFPYIQGVLAFDTPFLGISPGVVAHGAEGHYQNAQSAATAISQLSGWGTSLWGASKAAEAQAPSKSKGALPPAEGGKEEEKAGWGKWGKVAMYAGAASAVAGAGAAAWMNREQITSGWSWVSSHLEFVGCLARAEELKKRVKYMVAVRDEVGVGFANLYTRLGKAAPSKQVSMVGTVLGKERTFCNLPKREGAGTWREAVNDKAKDETVAHVSMFEETDNPGFERLGRDAKGFIVGWVQEEWYNTSVEERPMIEEKAQGEETQEEQRPEL